MAALSGFFISAFLDEFISQFVFFMIATGLTVVSGVLLYFFNDNPIIKEDFADITMNLSAE